MKRNKLRQPCRIPVSEYNWACIRKIKDIYKFHSMDEAVSYLIGLERMKGGER